VAVVSLGYRTDLMLLGLQGSVVEQRAGYQVVRSADIPTFYWGNFLLLDGPPAPGGIPFWMSTFAREFPGAEHVAIGVDNTDGETPDGAELAAAGLEAERNVVLTTSAITPPQRPNEAAEFRALDTDADWLAALRLQEASYDDSDPEGWQGFRGRRLQAKRRMQGEGFGAWFGAFSGGRMVSGLGIFGDGGGIARFQDVDTHPEHRNKGLAGTLVYRASQYALHDMGAQKLVIVAEPAGPAIRIYRSVGFRDAEIQVQLQRPVVG
jgi:GNAT superfamily N-acetyltransferase